MPTTDELQAQINALQSQLNSILGMSDDDYIHQYSGEEIDAGITAAGKAVRYDLAQSLTAAQQTQARNNIAAAPGGYGLGGDAKMLTSADNLDTLMTNGWFQYNRDNPPQGTLPTELASYASLIRVSAMGQTCLQEAFDPTDSNLHGTVLRRTIYGSGPGAKIYPWEWVNPPMQTGREYRTTERYLGKPVYAQVFALGKLSATAGNSSYSIFGSDMSVGKRTVVSDQYFAMNLDDGLAGWQNTMPFIDNGQIRLSGSLSGARVIIYTGGDWSSYYGYALMRYVKTDE